MKAREVHLIARPTGAMAPEHIDIVTKNVKQLKSGQFLVENAFMSVDPYMLGRMQGSITYDTPFELGSVMVGEAVGVVTASKNAKFPIGSEVQHFYGWRDRFVSDGESVRIIKRIEGVSLDAHLDILSRTTGLAAYAGLFDVADLQIGEAVFVTAGAGAVGAAVCQMALAMDCHVVASAGSDQKVRWLEEDIGVFRALNYKDYQNPEEFEAVLGECFPDGIDVLFENVGGIQMEAALWLMNNKGRIPLCGMIAFYEMDYNHDRTINTGPRNFIQIADRWLKVQGFSAPHYESQMGEFESQVNEWISSGKIKSRTTIVPGLDNCVNAMNGIMAGQNIGKMVVAI